MAYTSILFLLVPLVLLSGLAMSPQLDAAFHWLPGLFAGRQSARAFHFLAAGSFALFTFGHIFMVVATGVLNNMRSMVTGWYAEKITTPEETGMLLVKETVESEIAMEEPSPETVDEPAAGEAVEPMPEGSQIVVEEPGSEMVATGPADREPLEAGGGAARKVEKSETGTEEERRKNGEK
jgi:hypothetical protein